MSLTARSANAIWRLASIPADARFNAYRNGEVDMIGFLYDSDMTPAAMAQVMNDPKLKEQLITWPNFITFYNFFDTWNPPFDNLKVRQAFSHAIDRSTIQRLGRTTKLECPRFLYQGL